MTVGTCHVQWGVAALLLDCRTDNFVMGGIRCPGKGVDTGSKVIQLAGSSKVKKIIDFNTRQRRNSCARHVEEEEAQNLVTLFPFAEGSRSRHGPSAPAEQRCSMKLD